MDDVTNKRMEYNLLEIVAILVICLTAVGLGFAMKPSEQDCIEHHTHE